MNLWIVGNLTDVESTSFEFVGVFSSEHGALEACRGHANYFVGPVVLDKLAPEDGVAWPGIYIPDAANSSFEIDDRYHQSGRRQ